ncbi:MAG: hypothetical protein JWO80_1801 [Bryobacterales bacterium]|nr:hypothetical protein [Bryobacterales bacterium]
MGRVFLGFCGLRQVSFFAGLVSTSCVWGAKLPSPAETTGHQKRWPVLRSYARWLGDKRFVCGGSLREMSVMTHAQKVYTVRRPKRSISSGVGSWTES